MGCEATRGPKTLNEAQKVKISERATSMIGPLRSEGKRSPRFGHVAALGRARLDSTTVAI